MESNSIFSEKINFYYSSSHPVFAKVIESEFFDNRLEHEELVQLDNGITLELKWGGPFRREGSYQVGETIALVNDGTGFLTVIRYRDSRPLCQERFVEYKNGYYISDI